MFTSDEVGYRSDDQPTTWAYDVCARTTTESLALLCGEMPSAIDDCDGVAREVLSIDDEGVDDVVFEQRGSHGSAQSEAWIWVRRERESKKPRSGSGVMI